MKYFYWALLAILTCASCQNTGKENDHRLVCSQQNGLFYRGYKGRVKKITSTKAPGTNVNGTWFLNTAEFF